MRIAQTKVLLASLSFILVVGGLTHAQLDYIDINSPNVTTDPADVVNTDLIDGNPIREGTRFPVESPDGQNQAGIIDQGEIQTYEQGQLQTIALIRNIVNYFLGFLGLIALVIFIWAGLRLVTAGDDDTKYQDAVKDVRRVGIAIGGIALSWFIVTFIFYLVRLIIA